jgi:YD repeat-containing protein
LWEGPYSTGIIGDIASFDVKSSGNRVLISTIVRNESDDELHIWEGVVDEGTIKCVGEHWVRDVGYAEHPANLGSSAITDDGLLWSSATMWNSDTSQHGVYIDRSYGSSSNDHSDDIWFSTEPYVPGTCILVPKPGSFMTAIVPCRAQDGTMYVLCWEFEPERSTSDWDYGWSARFIDPWMLNLESENDISAVSTPDGIVHVAYADTYGRINYARITGDSVEDMQDFEASAGREPAITVDPMGCLHLFFIQDSAEVMYAHAEPSTTYSSPFWEPITAYEAESSLYYLHTSAACAHEAMVTFYGIGRTTVLLLGTIPIQSMMQNVGRNSDAWNRVGLADNEPYEVMLDGYVSVGNGLLTVRQTDIAIPGRCGMDLEIARVYKSPTAMINGVTFSTGDLLAAPIASGWNFDFPCIGMKYADYLGLYAGPFLHLWGGQEYFITWDGDVFENHNGEHFTLTRTPYGDTPWYTYRLHDKEGVVYDLDTAGRVSKISDPTGHNMITFTYSPDVLIYITDSIGRRATFTYATNGTLSKVAYAGRNTTYVVDHLSNRLLKVIDDLGRTTNYSYDAQGLLTRVTYPSEGFFSVSYDIAWLSTDAYYFPATSIRSYPDSYTRLRAAYFDYELYQGRVVHTEARYYGASDYDYKGKATHSFRTSDSGYLMSLIDSQGNRLRTIHTWYSGSGGVECQDVYSGQNATPSRSIGICDDWGNLIYSKDAVSHERFYTYLYTSTQGSFIAPATFNRVTSGKILYRNFDDRIYSDWTIGSSGVYAIDTEFSPWQAPSLRLTYGTAYAYVAKQIGVSLDADDVFAADVAVSSGSGTDLLQLRTSTGTSLIRIQLASDSSILVSDYSLGYLVWRNQGTFEPGRFYQISIRMTTHSAGGAYYYTASVNGIQTSGTLKSLSGDISQVYCLRSTAGDAWLDNVKVMESPLLNINAEYLHKVTVTSLDGAYLGSFRSVDSARDESLDVSNWLKYLPNVVIAIRDPADTTIGQCFRGDVWGGDWLDFVPRYENSSFKRTTSGFANTNLFSQLYVNNDWPAGSTPIDPWYDVEDPWNDGSDFENASTGSYDYHHSSYWSGLHYHGFTSTTTMPVNADTTYIAQYVYLLPGMLPNQLSVGFTDLTGESRAFWGQDLITGLPGTDEFRVSPTIAAEPGRWSVFCVKAGDIPGLSGSVKGVRYALHGGTARWGMMASGDSAIATLTITGLPVQRVVKLSIAETDGVYVLNSGTSGTVSINLYQTAGISVFPVTASWSVLNIYQNYVESSSPWTKVFGGDVYGYTPSAFGLHYEQDSFDLDEPLSHGLLAGTLDYQTGRANPSSLISRSYMEYCDSDGIASPSKIVQLYNRTWVTTGVLAYSRYGNLLDHTSADGVVTLFSYDSTQTYPIHSTEYGWPNTLTTSYVFNQTNGQLISVTGPGSDAPVTSYEYDIIGRVTEVIYPAVNGRSMHEYIDYQDEYRTVEITRESEALGGTLCYEYDGLGRLVGAADHYSWWYYEYDWQDRLTLAEQYATKRHAFYWTEYDLLGRVTKNAVGEVDTTNLSVTQTVYDDAKRSWKSYDASNHAVGYIADLAGRVTSVREYYSLTSPYYNETTYSYDESGNLVTTMDPLGGVTSYGYDEFGRAISITYPDLKNLRYDLTPSGLPEVVFRRDGWKEKYGYDGHMRLTDKTWTKDASSKHFEYNDEG